jgi:hypothetical protein
VLNLSTGAEGAKTQLVIAFQRGTMKHLVESVIQAVTDGNWYAALTVALTLPDICGKLESPQDSSTRRYVRWFNENLAPKYTFNATEEP